MGDGDKESEVGFSPVLVFDQNKDIGVSRIILSDRLSGKQQKQRNSIVELLASDEGMSVSIQITRQGQTQEMPITLKYTPDPVIPKILIVGPGGKQIGYVGATYIDRAGHNVSGIQKGYGKEDPDAEGAVDLNTEMRAKYEGKGIMKLATACFALALKEKEGITHIVGTTNESNIASRKSRADLPEIAGVRFVSTEKPDGKSFVMETHIL